MPKARELWSKIISRGHSKSAQWWLARIQFERLSIELFLLEFLYLIKRFFFFSNRTHDNNYDEVRKLFTKSLNAVSSSDWPELIVKQWLQFEREEGDLQTMDVAQHRFGKYLKPYEN